MEIARCMNDPIYFMCTYMKVQHPVRGSIPFEMYDYQKQAVKAFLEHDDCIVMLGRQMGKTTVIAAFLLWFTCFKPEKYVLVASKDNDAAMDVLNRIRFSYEELPMWLKPGCVYFNRHEISFDNGSTIKSSATTEGTGRGRSISLLMIDELAFVNRQIQQAMWTSLAPTLSTGGQCIISSTPNGDQDLFAQLWRAAEGEAATVGEGEETVEIDFYPVFAPWYSHPDRGNGEPDSKEGVLYKKRMIAKVGELMFRQEYASMVASTTVNIMHNGVPKEMAIGDVYELLYNEGQGQVREI